MNPQPDIQNNDAMAVAPRIILVATAVLAFAGALGVLVFCSLYVRHTGNFLDRLQVNVGEVLMEEGMRLEKAGALENAKERYELALESRFQGEQNRVLTVKRLGALLWMQQEYEAALPYLSSAAESPHAPVSVYQPLCDTLYRLERYDEMDPPLEAWVAALEDTSVAPAAFYQGKLALAREDDEAALKYFLNGVNDTPGGRNAAEAGWLLYQAERYVEALEQFDAYLRSGASGARAEWIRGLHASAIEKLSEGG